MERYDMDCGIEELDMESVMALLELQDLWSSRRRLRERWMARKGDLS